MKSDLRLVLHAEAGQNCPNRLQKRKCCMMGNLDSTSTWYIFIMPLFTCRRQHRNLRKHS